MGQGTDFWSDPPQVEFGPGIQQTGALVISSDGTSFNVPIQVEANAPVGERSVLVSNEDALFAQVSFEVRQAGQAIRTGCDIPATGGIWGPWMGLLIFTLVFRRRP